MLALTSALVLAAAAAEQDGLYKADSPVTSLASAGVPAHNSSDQPFMLVEFYSAWCGHCQHFAPTYEELARVAKQRLPSLTVGAVNCPSHQDACSEHKVSSFPTILLFPGNHRYGSHNRSVEGILAWVATQRAAPQEVANALATHGHLPVLGTAAAAGIATAGIAAADIATAAAASHRTERTGLGTGLGTESPASRRKGDPAGRRAELLEELLGGGGGGGGTVGGAALGSAAAAALGSAAAAARGQLLNPRGGRGSQWRAVPDATQGKGSLSHLAERKAWQPVPAGDLYAAARYTLSHEVLTHVHAGRGAEGEDDIHVRSSMLRPLLEWLLALQRGLPRDADGGVAVVAVGELRGLLMRKGGMVERAEWSAMLETVGVDKWPQEWQACSSSNPALHAYPCSLWMLFHTLASHASTEHALQTTHAIRLYVGSFFGCEDCAAHFGNMSRGMEAEMAEMAPQHSSRDRAALWMWQAHNQVNARLAAQPDHSFDEFLKVEWPTPAACPDCHEVAISQRGSAATRDHLLRQWRHDQVLRYLHRSYCLEPRFECWAELQSGSRRPPAQLRSQLGTWGTLAAAALLFCIACRRRGGRSAEKPPDHKV